MEERKRKLLERLEGFFKEDEDIDEVSLFTKEELETPMDVLRALVTEYGGELIDILAEYSFLPLPGEEQEIWYFSSVITIASDLPAGSAGVLSGAISRLNFYLPYGAFCLSTDGTMLIYKTVAALRTEEDDETLYKDMELSADTALLIPESYTDLLLRVSDGRMTLSEFIAVLPE